MCLINNKWYKDRKESRCDENEWIVKAAAKLIAAQIWEVEHDMKLYLISADSTLETGDYVSSLF